MSRDYDIAVVGGGLAGATFACALADTGLSIALVEAVAFDAPADENMKARTTAIAAAAGTGSHPIAAVADPRRMFHEGYHTCSPARKKPKRHNADGGFY